MIIGNPIMAGASGPAASIFVTGLSETDTVTATNGAKTLTGKWKTVQKNVNVQVPTMTSNTSPSGECFAKSNAEEFDAQPYYAFVGSPVPDKAAHSTSGDAQGWWIGYDFGYDVKIEYFEICPQYRSNYTFWCRIAQTLTLQGSNDGSTWDDIQSFTRTDHLTDDKSSDTHEILKFTVDNPVTYRMFRVVWTTLTPTADAYSTCSYVQFVGTKIEEVSGHLIQPIRDFGTWTVTATDGEKTTTQDVLVDVITEYEIEMVYKPVGALYWLGDECEDITGGWTCQAGIATSSVQKEDNSIYTDGLGDGSGSISITNNAIDLTNYSKIYAEVSDFEYGRCGPVIQVVYDSVSYSNPGTFTGCGWPQGSLGTGIIDASTINYGDISGLTGLHKIGFLVATGGAYSDSYIRGHLYKIWLE